MPELLFAVCAMGKTGRLVLQAGDVEKNVFLSDGQVVFAASSSPDDRLGAYMLQRNELSLDDLMRLSPQVRPGVRLGTLLVQHGLVPSSHLIRAVGGQIKAIVLSLFGWAHVAYAFLEESSQQSVRDEAIRLTIPTPRLIVDGIDSVPSWERIARGQGDDRVSARSRSASVSWEGTSVRFQIDRRARPARRVVEARRVASSMRSADLDTPSLELLAMLRHPKSVKELCEASDMPDIAVCRKLWAFRVLDWVRPADEISELDLDLEGLRHDLRPRRCALSKVLKVNNIAGCAYWAHVRIVR